MKQLILISLLALIVRRLRVNARALSAPVLTGEAFIVPKDENDLLNRLRNPYDVANGADWRLHDVNIVPVRSLE